jgi:large subunit ribosomal protein L1
VDFRLDKTSVIHAPIGKASFDENKLFENLSSLMESVMKAKPKGAKGQYIKSATIATSMGPAIKLDLKPTMELKAL